VLIAMALFSAYMGAIQAAANDGNIFLGAIIGAATAVVGGTVGSAVYGAIKNAVSATVAGALAGAAGGAAAGIVGGGLTAAAYGGNIGQGMLMGGLIGGAIGGIMGAIDGAARDANSSGPRAVHSPNTSKYTFKGVQSLQVKMDCLELVFNEPVGGVVIEENSSFWGVWGKDTLSTTRFNTIYLKGSLNDFWNSPGMTLEEYYHVLKQWNTNQLTEIKYAIESLKHGYWQNKFELEAWDFVDKNIQQYKNCVECMPHW
jgi:hypothetical protein